VTSGVSCIVDGRSFEAGRTVRLLIARRNAFGEIRRSNAT